MAKDDEQITMSKAELEAMLSKRDADAKMDPAEKRVREIVRDESELTFRKVLGEFFAPGDDDDDGDDGKSGGENDGGLGGFAKLIGLNG